MFAFFKKGSTSMGSGSSVADERKAKRDALKAQREEERKERGKARKESKAQAAAAEKAAEEALERQQREAEREQAALATQLQSQLAQFQKYAKENAITAPILDGDDGTGVGVVGGTQTNSRGRKPVGVNDTIADAENISIHSSDLQDEELLQGLQDLDDELEQEYQDQVDALEAKIEEYKAASLHYLREENNKPKALESLQAAKKLEAELVALRNGHEKPLAARIDEAKERVDELDDQVKERKQEALSKLRAGEKPVALEIMREVKGLEAQLEAAKAELAQLVQEREQQLKPSTSSKSR